MGYKQNELEDSELGVTSMRVWRQGVTLRVTLILIESV